MVRIGDGCGPGQKILQGIDLNADRYQIVLIVLGIAATALIAHFLYHEVFPEYKIYQNDYIALEAFRSTYTGQPPPEFKEGVKQIVFEREDKGPAKIDRCTSCHVATDLFHFSPTKIKRDAKGQVVYDAEGLPEKVPNDDYVWGRLNQKISELTDDAVNAQLTKAGQSAAVEQRKKEAAQLASYKTANVDGHVYDVTKVLAMHPLIGKETRPFEFHPLEDYGCTSCHSGNGRALTALKAHGPVFDGEYETEFMGPKPEFTEKDRWNDPQFARVFNDKPSDSLLFQTTPILVGNLIQSSCIQCHGTPQAGTNEGQHALAVDQFTQNFDQGRELYISQACYACHRIAGLARGGVGPELTLAGNNYPWYLKESIVWPQADLRTSTMPNFVLDHEEIEDLMTFLLAQKGPSPAVSQTAYKVGIQQWEAGKKMPWEEPVAPSQIHDLRYSMTVFATQGCASCHRLEGFESNVGFRVEKDKDPGFDKLYQEHQWFRKLFPEESRGSAIVRTLESNAKEIDEHIVSDVRQGSILEEIEKEFPGVIEAFYSNFRFAQRAKNHEEQQKASTATDEENKNIAKADLEVWKERVHRVLMMYIQEYGLGRLIGPRPNWSGVYRSDEWLMEHFHNPASHVPRSIMPVFPFDDTKFYALTYMLDVLGKRNRDAVRTVWEHRGFNPNQAFDLFCSQCHGPYLQGDGPVAAWIYPIPKNLRSAEFMHSLTRARVIQSVMHGVQGTPMPPWGETPKPKPGYDGVPVLTLEEIVKLVDWLFSSLPGGTVLKGSEDVPKWQYMPKDIIEELKREGNKLESGEEVKGKPSAWLYPESHQVEEVYYASLIPLVPISKKKDDDVDEIFDVVPNPISGEDRNLYYIKSKYYTKSNLEKGQQFFEINCAVCHGKEADGMGMRASVMFDAKPRMLTNLDWLKTRDDLRLLRSIKYGVPGTGMTPWGDLTSSLQRLQLVIYIRSLSEEKGKRDALQESLYIAFDADMSLVEQARIHEYPVLDAFQKELKSTEEERRKQEKILDEKQPLDFTIDLYKKQLQLEQKIDARKAVDQQLLKLQELIGKQKDLYQGMGNELISIGIADDLWQKFLELVALSSGRLTFDAGNLSFHENPEKQKQNETLVQEIANGLNDKDKKKFLEKFAEEKTLIEKEKALFRR